MEGKFSQHTHFDGAGHTLILRREGSYVWNSDIPVELDIDEFDRLCKAGANARSEEKRIELPHSSSTSSSGVVVRPRQ